MTLFLCVVVWDREEAEAERQLGDVTVYKDVNFREKMLQDLAESSNKVFRDLKRGNHRKTIEVFYD